jgi:hypothetical protein
MDVQMLQQQVSRAQEDATFFETLSTNPETVISDFDKIEDKVKTGMVSVAEGANAAELHKFSRYEACTSTSCGCGGSI